ncbi:hypothetical protein [Kribbella sp. NPDC004875]|uniref:hypothetical protein n=1 Tax=Kribbella sp. NPDC004875 TaxID=3364107 RepID=UPI0036C65346
MNPVDEVDDLLTRAGHRWRADQAPPPEPDLEYMLSGGRKRRRWVPALAAASVAVIAAGVVAVLPGHSATQPASTPAAGGTEGFRGQGVQSSPQAVAQSNDQLLVKPGDKVQASGLVIAAPGKAPVFCPFEGGPDIGYPPGKEPAPSCAPEFAVTLKGVDLDRLTEQRTTHGVRSGRAKLVGIWGDRSIDVQQQAAPATPAAWTFPPLPCAAPAGGWVSKPSNVSSPAVNAFLAAHADQIFGPVIHYPNGRSRNAPVVVMVGVAHGDLTTLRQALEKVYSGNLCVAPVLLSRSDNERIVGAVTPLMQDKSLGIQGTGGSDPDGGRAKVSMIAYTQQVKTALTPIGLDDLQVVPVVTPAK